MVAQSVDRSDDDSAVWLFAFAVGRNTFNLLQSFVNDSSLECRQGLENCFFAALLHLVGDLLGKCGE